MNLEHFHCFLSVTHPGAVAELTEEQIRLTGKAFKSYLQKIFEGNEKKLEEIWNIDPVNAMKNMDHPFRTKGFHPALILHFDQFIKNELAKLDHTDLDKPKAC